MKSIVKRISNLFGSIVLVAMVLAGGLSVPMTAAAGPAMCPATLDIALVFDRSASMGYDNPDPIQPLTDAQDATVAFIDMLDGDDKVALVDFAEGAIITNPLTFDHAAVKASVELDELKKWTNTGAGIDAGHEELTGPNGRGGVKKVIILLSDGNPTKPSNESYAATYALGKADDAKADGIVIYTIGVGSSTSATSTLFMQGVASEDSNYYYAPTLEELEDAYEEIASEVCEPDTVTLIASKVVCENESLLPDLSGQSVNITDSTANDYVAAIQGCSLESGWSFQWGDQNVSDPGGDHYGEANVSGWTTFGLTNVDGVVSTEIDISGMTQIRVREVLQSGYIPFTYPPTDDAESAEFYCSGDVLHYDNFDFVTNLTADETYYCVAFNAPEATYECSDGIDNDGDGLTDYPNDLGCDCFDDDDENDRPVITVDPTSITLTVGDSFDPYNGHATADDAEDGDITGSLTASSSVDTATVGTYYVDYDVVDSDGAAADTKTLTVNVVSEPPHYGPYCGDGIVQPELMEQCDTGHLVGGDPIVGCSVQCQIMGAPVCSEDVFARAVVTDVQNFQEDADMTEDIFLGTSTLPIPSWAWFPVYYDGSYINDDSIEGYEDVPGLAVQRDNGSITVRHYGSHPSPSDGTKEHVEGYLEFYNAGVLGIENDDASGNNQMENWGPDMVAEKSLSAGKDAAWSATTTSNFWMTVTIADDSYFTTYALPPECEDDPELITIVATKIVCENESDLPNWGAVQTPIDENTAADFLNDNEYCSIATGWQFQWAPKVTGNPGDNTGEAGGDWTTFIESTEIELSELPEGVDDYVWVREVWNEEYIPFTGANTTENESAEIYCHIDTINYDNYDRVDGITEGGIYYCVAFNVPVEVPPQCVIEGYKYDYDTGEGIADWTIGLAEINTCQNDDDAWADFVVEYNPVGDIMLDRIDPNQALGVAERSQGYDFVSLGLDHIGGPPGGELILGFDNLILNGEGDDLEVVETSWGDPSCQDYSETVQVYASQDGTTWEYLGQTCLDGTFDLGSLPWAQ
ncbi:MAG: VWA domain-containing protein, partial [Candidatus Pacebacteria bacterium]|nr:VWA domain-containing protein [Candidatus Paceibacterota bacterium]